MKYMNRNNFEPTAAALIEMRLIRCRRYKETLRPVELHWKKCAKWSAFALKLEHMGQRLPVVLSAKAEAQLHQRTAGAFS